MSDLDEDLEVDLTPLIDVIFMLIIFFIMTMSFTLPVVDFDLPKSTTAQVSTKSSSLKIKVSEDGVFSIDENVVSKDELAKIINQRSIESKNRGDNVGIELVIDSRAPTQYLIEVADLARQYTEGRLSIISEKIDNSDKGPSDHVAPSSPSAAAASNAAQSIISPNEMGGMQKANSVNQAPAVKSDAASNEAVKANANGAKAATNNESSADNSNAVNEPTNK